MLIVEIEDIVFGFVIIGVVFIITWLHVKWLRWRNSRKKRDNVMMGE